MPAVPPSPAPSAAGPPLSDAFLPLSDSTLPAPPTSPNAAGAAVRAEPREWSVPVKLSGDDPRLKFEIHSLAKCADRKVALFVCDNPCTVLLPRGEYRVHVSGGPEHADGDRKIEVKAASSFYFSLPDRTAKYTGLGLAITGTTLLPVGLFVALLASKEAADCLFDCPADERRYLATPAGVYVGLGMVAVGAVLTPVGWATFAGNRKPRFQERALGATRKEIRTLRVGIGAAPIPGGAAAGLWGRF